MKKEPAKSLTRRLFIRKSLLFGLGLGLSPLWYELLFSPRHGLARIGKTGTLKEAMWYKRLDERTVQCELCPHRCILKDGMRSFCRVREPKGGKLYTLVYELACSRNVDPIEKKPIFHMLPGSQSFSIATAGCNSRCKFCQNWTISQRPPEEVDSFELSCEKAVELAKYYGCSSIAYTYSEPTVFYEYMLDTAKVARRENIKNVCVTGGLINSEPLERLSEYIDCANVDFKGFSDDYLRTTCAQNLKTIKEALKTYKRKGVWVEVTNLLVPTLNDEPAMIKDLCMWIKDNMGPETPLHFSRFWPMYKLKNLYPTPVETLERARDIALGAGLHYVYIGNVPGHEGNNTFCPKCKKILVERIGYVVRKNNIIDSKCKFCGFTIAGIWAPADVSYNPQTSLRNKPSRLAG